MCTADGEQLLAGPFEGIRSFRTSASKLEEITQERPNDATWDIWRSFLHHHFIHPNKDIRTPLGCWLTNSNDMTRLWVFYYSNRFDQLYRGYRTRWHRHDKYQYDTFNRIGNTEYFSYDANKTCTAPPSDQRSTRHTTTDMLSKLPNDAVPCDINDAPEGWEICDHYPYVPPPETPVTTPPTIHSNIASQPRYIRQYYEHIEFYNQAPTHSNERSLYDFLHTDDTLSIATDGGVAAEVGSIGIVFSDDQLNRFCHTWGQASGLRMDSFRTEVCAALAATRFLQIYYEHWNSITTDQTMEENDQAQATNCIIHRIDQHYNG